MRPWTDRNDSDAPRGRGGPWAWLCTLLVAGYAVVPLIPAEPAGQIRLFQGAYLLASAGWIGWIVLLRSRRAGLPSLRVILPVAVLLRLPLSAVEPNDDVYRYLWEGRVRLAGINPYVHAPDDPQLASLRDATWTKINHRNHAAIYPPLAQLVFLGLAAVHPSVTTIRVAILAADVLTALVLAAWLRRRGDDPRRVAVYALAPLVLWSFAREAHYDALMMLALAALLWRCDTHRPLALGDLLAGALALGAAIGLKWVAAVLLPWWIVRAAAGRLRSLRGWIETGIAAGLPAAVVVLAAMAYLDHGWGPLFGPLRHFARTFHTLDWPRQQLLRVASPQGVMLISAGVVAAVALGLAVRRVRGPTAVTWGFVPVVVLTPTLHPWYVTWPLVGMVARPVPALIALTVSIVVAEQARYLQVTTGAWQLPRWAAAAVWWPVVAVLAVQAALAVVRRLDGHSGRAATPSRERR